MSPRILIVGTSGSGKTTLAKALSQKLHCPHIELDSLGWKPGWVKTPDEEFICAVRDAISAESWVVCGNWSIVKDLLWKRATHLIWLQLPFRIVLWRLFKRTMKNLLTKRKVAGGNQETFFQQFFTKQSIFLWVFQTHWKRKKTYQSLLSSGKYSHLNVVIIKSANDQNKTFSKKFL